MQEGDRVIVDFTKFAPSWAAYDRQKWDQYHARTGTIMRKHRSGIVRPEHWWVRIDGDTDMTERKHLPGLRMCDWCLPAASLLSHLDLIEAPTLETYEVD